LIFQSKDGKDEKVFDALDWLAAMTSLVPTRVEELPWLRFLLCTLRFSKPKKLRFENQIETFACFFQLVAIGKKSAV
jgi:hypothetical protein